MALWPPCTSEEQVKWGGGYTKLCFSPSFILLLIGIPFSVTPVTHMPHVCHQQLDWVWEKKQPLGKMNPLLFLQAKEHASVEIFLH